MRKLTALNELYHHPPTNEEIEDGFRRAMHHAWLELSNLYGLMEACQKDGVLINRYCPVAKALKEMRQVCDMINLDWGWELNLPPDPVAVAATA
jgi:hypothetical protein